MNPEKGIVCPYLKTKKLVEIEEINELLKKEN
jgi:hypothetical protein